MKNTLNSVKKQPRHGKATPRPAPSVPERTIGIDLGFERSAYCEVNEAGEVVADGWVLTTRATLRAKWEAAPVKGRVVIEACGLSSWVGEEFVAMGYELVVANPAKKATVINVTLRPPEPKV